MTDNSNAIDQALTEYSDNLIGYLPTLNSQRKYKAGAKQALYEAVAASVPEKKAGAHNNPEQGFNVCRAQVLTNLADLFGIAVDTCPDCNEPLASIAHYNDSDYHNRAGISKEGVGSDN